MRWVKRIFWGLGGLAALALLLLLGVRAYLAVDFRRTELVYGRRSGCALTLDVFEPGGRRNGRGLMVLNSGSWKSSHDGIEPRLFAPFLRRGYTLFVVSHGSQPRFLIQEIAEDVQRAVRFVRHRAAEYGCDPNRLGVIGGSSGGHLCLMLATCGGPGAAGATDPIDRESSAVQAVACFYPVTDLLNLGRSTENLGDGGPPRSFRTAFGPTATNLADWKPIGGALSPILHVTDRVPPTLIIHGGADTLVPLDQSERYVREVNAVGGTIQLLVRPGKKHGWPTMVFDLFRMADWLDTHL